MARGKKKEELTLEEKLERALVPVEEQPYEVPENWCWVRLENAFHILNGYAFKSQKYVDSGIRIIRIANVQDGYIEDDKPVFYPLEMECEIQKYMLEAGDLLISLTGNVGRVAFLDNDMLPAALNQRVGCLRLKNTIFNKSFLFYYFIRQEFQDSCIKNSKGSAQLNMSTEWLKLQPIPLPPLTEQQRIVDRVESLFAKLDEAKEKVQEVIDQYELKTTSILHKAFVGDLSLKWRTMHGTMKENWDVKRIKDVCKPRAGYAFNSKKFQNHGCQIIRMGNLYGGVLDLSRSPVFICEDELDEKIIERAKIKNGDILITLTGTKYKRDYGYAVCIENPENLYVNQRILCLTPNANINRDYLLYYLRSNIFRDIFFSNETGGVNQGNVSSKFVENIEIQVPPIEEQIEIITVMNNILLKEERAKKFAECVLQRIDLMKKSILTKAFRGELGTNNPEEESAIKLLKKYL